MIDICITVDLEPDCPPYLKGWRGMDEGTPKLLDLLERSRTPATFFTTGATGKKYPQLMDTLVEEEHELACHGQTHKAFSSMDLEEAEWEIESSTDILRAHGPVTAFRAPYLRFPERYLPLLEQRGYERDASRSRYKPIHWGPPASTPLHRVLASTTSSVLRLPTLDPGSVAGSASTPCSPLRTSLGVRGHEEGAHSLGLPSWNR